MQNTLDEQFRKVQAAATCLGDHVKRTPVIHSLELDDALGAQVWLKCENVQHTGAFKFRGAMHALLQLSEAERAAGVYTVSSGNHGAALAAAGQQLGIQVRVGVATNASAVKRANMERYNAELIAIEPGMPAREAFVASQQGNGRSFIPPYNHEWIVAGQGTAALELVQAQPRLNVLVAPLGGGGLLSGTSIVARQHGMAALGIEPELAADGHASLQAGTIQPAMPPNSICDGLLTNLGTVTFPLLQQHVKAILLVSDTEAEQAQQLCFDHTDMWIEPSSAVVLAAIKRYPDYFHGQRVGVIISGGNVAKSGN